MRTRTIWSCTFSSLVLTLLAAPVMAQEQAHFSCYGLLDYAPGALGLEGACGYGGPRVTVGIFAGMYHPRSVGAFQPNMEGYGYVDARFFDTWHATLHLGAGWTETTGVTARFFLAITNPVWPVSPWVNLYGHTNFGGLGYGQIRAGARFVTGSHGAVILYAEIPFATPISTIPLGIAVVFY